MNLLLDTHTLLWLMQGASFLSPTATALLANSANRVYLSMASVWEIAIKSGLRKMGLTVPYATFLRTAINGYGLIVLPITVDDCLAYESLPFPYPSHRDPFDRMLITQAIRNSFSILGRDAAFDSYPVTRLW